jgi:3-methyl-2-oxobutanoate hydroxymethyltransferase
MSTLNSVKSEKITVPSIRTRKNKMGGAPIVCLTAYTKPMAQLLDPHVDLILVGDSVGMVIYGFDSTLPVTLDMMIDHGAAVTRGAKRALVVVDMPFGTYQLSPQQAYTNAARIMAETGCAAVKIEGGSEMAATVEFLSKRGIPVMAHIGLMPQSAAAAGGYRAHGRETAEADYLLQSARKLQEAGAFAIVLEGIVEPLAARITTELAIPTIGIGASPACDGQILVTDDMLGLFQDFTPKFVRKFAQLGEQVTQAVQDYANAVRTHEFPTTEHCFGVKPLALTAITPANALSNQATEKKKAARKK